MFRIVTIAIVLSLVGRTARADDDPMYACKPLPATAKITAQLKPETSLQDLVTWIMGFTCKNVAFGTDVLPYATKITVVAPNKMTPKQAFQLFVDAVESTGLLVVVKNDTIQIKLGPNMPRRCPTTAPAISTTGGVPVTAEVPPSVPEPEITDADLDAGIKKIDATHREIKRDLVDRILANPMAIAKGARVVPAMKNGKAIGFKLYAIRPASVYAKLGFENGDTMLTINGFDLTSADKALEVYAKIREAKTLEIDLERKGKPVRLVLAIK